MGETAYTCVLCGEAIVDEAAAAILTAEWLPSWQDGHGLAQAQSFAVHSACLRDGWKGTETWQHTVLFGEEEPVEDDYLDGLKLRVATLDDRDAIDAMLPGAFQATLSRFYGTERLQYLLPWLSYVQSDLLTCGTFYVFSDGAGQILACGGWTRAAPGTGRVEDGLAHVRHFATVPQFMRRGLARRIFDRCAAEAKLAGLRELTCDAVLGSEAFYGAMNFAMVGQRTLDPGGAALPVFALRKSLF